MKLPKDTNTDPNKTKMNFLREEIINKITSRSPPLMRNKIKKILIEINWKLSQSDLCLKRYPLIQQISSVTVKKVKTPLKLIVRMTFRKPNVDSFGQQ